MKPIRIGSALRIEIGYDGENGARQIVFDATKWMDELPGCTAAITAVRADGEHYIAPKVTQDEEKKTITWTLTSAETMEGEGRAQLLWMDGERIAKQAIFTTVCHESLQNDATEIDVPEPVWAQQSLAAAKAAKASAEAAAASEEGAKAALEETKGVRDNAKTEIDEKKASAIDGINNAKAEAIASIEAEKDELAPPIICTTSGTVITMTDSADRPLRGLTVFGRTEQDGVPSEDAPAALDSVGSKGSVELTLARGMPDTIVIIRQPRHFAGAVGETAQFEVTALGYGLTYQWQWKGTSAWDNTGLPGNKTASLSVTVTESRNGNMYRCVITDENGHTATTQAASLTIGDAAESDDTVDDTQTVAISIADALRGVPASGGDVTYTDADGQGWIADTIEYDAQAGTAQIVRRVGSVTYDGSGDEEWAKSFEKSLFAIFINGCAQTSHGLCTHYEVGDIVADQGAYGFSAGAWPGLIVVRPADYADLTVDAWRARLNASPVTVLYALANPVVTALSTDELAEMSALRSRYLETTVLSDDGAHMSVQYIADTKKYVDDADTEMAKAIMAVDERVDAAIEQTADVGGRADAAQKKADENENEIGKLKGDLDELDDILTENAVVRKTEEITVSMEDGLYRLDGSFSGSTNYIQTGKIDVQSGDELWIEGITNGTYRIVNARFITAYVDGVADTTLGKENLAVKYVVPEGVTSVIFSMLKSVLDLSTLKMYKTFNSHEKTYKNEFVSSGNIIYGKKWCACGDSFTAGSGSSKIVGGKYDGENIVYPYIIANRNNMDICSGFFVGGKTLAFPENAGSFTNSLTCPSSVSYYQNIPSDVDYITIYLGINDGHHAIGDSITDGEVTEGYIGLGTIDDTTTATYYGAWNVVLSWLIQNRPFAHIGIIVSNGVNDNSWRLAQIEIAKKYGIPYIDLNGDERCPVMIRSVNPDISEDVKNIVKQKQAVDYDGSKTGSVNLHPNDYAHEYESTFIEAFLRSI